MKAPSILPSTVAKTWQITSGRCMMTFPFPHGHRRGSARRREAPIGELTHTHGLGPREPSRREREVTFFSPEVSFRAYTRDL